jgi:hypothetical protein
MRVDTVIVLALTLGVGCSGPREDAVGAAPGPPRAIEGGTIRGAVRVEPPVPEPTPLPVWEDPWCTARHPEPPAADEIVVGAGGGLADVLVAVDEGPVPAAEGQPTVQLRFDGCRLIPRLVAMAPGTTLVISSADGTLHEPRSAESAAPSFAHRLAPGASPVEVHYEWPQPRFRVGCAVHPWEEAAVYVLENPFFTVTDADGTFELAGLPAGDYKLRAEHRGVRQTASVALAADSGAWLDFTFSGVGGQRPAAAAAAAGAGEGKGDAYAEFEAMRRHLQAEMDALAAGDAGPAAPRPAEGRDPRQSAEPQPAEGRDPRPLAEPRPRFVEVERGVLRDAEHPLEWTRRTNDAEVNWHDAVRYCEQLRTAGRDDWRLPTIDELQSLSSRRHQETECGEAWCRIHPLFDLGGPWVWSSEEDGAARARAFDFLGGEPYSVGAQYQLHRVLCARDASTARDSPFD